jgi:hypothetical protein
MNWQAMLESLHAVDATLAGPWLLLALLVLGTVVGALTGLFGVGGAFMITPLLANLLRVDWTLAVGSSLSFTIGSSSAGWLRHARLGNVAYKPMFIMAGAAVCGTTLGAHLHQTLKSRFGPDRFDMIMQGLFIALLVVVALLVLRAGSRDRSAKSLLQRLPLPPRINLSAAGIDGVSLPGLCMVGLLMGVCSGTLGIGGGVIFMPMLLLVVGLNMHLAVGTSLGVVLCSALAGVLIYGARGQASLWIVAPLLVGSSIGVQLGAWLCDRLNATRLRRYFALVVIVVAGYLGVNFLLDLR